VPLRSTLASVAATDDSWSPALRARRHTKSAHQPDNHQPHGAHRTQTTSTTRAAVSPRPTNGQCEPG